jgi:predicted nucleotidyltransferase
VAFVYGSVAREQETAQSDIDLMVVGKATLDEVLSRLTSVEKSIGRPINPTVYSVAEFNSKLAGRNHFLNAVLNGQKVFLVGDGDELRKVGGVRWLRRELTSPGEIKDLLGSLIAAWLIQGSKPYRPISDLSRLSTRRLASQLLHSAPQVIAP